MMTSKHSEADLAAASVHSSFVYKSRWVAGSVSDMVLAGFPEPPLIHSTQHTCPMSTGVAARRAAHTAPIQIPLSFSAHVWKHFQ
jgi:hypothetical protein